MKLFKMADAHRVRVDPIERIQEEYQAWKRYHPKDFIANPSKKEDGSTDWLTWKCGIPGPEKSPWEGGLYPMQMEFPTDYPYSPPKCIFTPALLHPNVFPSGTVSLSLIDKNKGWKPQVTMKQVLLGIQLLLKDPNFHEPAQAEAFVIHSQSSLDYENKVKELAKQMDPARSNILQNLIPSAS
ncbi:SUMO-conjugating enzyme UBC9-B-like [Actinia tenebrosa]|uniref:SUMO-conjugating enzyme UBC9-B-like n=1 Tax=Actinia tenebrosa TaxID=6105 RepID=A0A6P8JFW5_ACTTE|nr:SUMO-conjugating enzyme UBC9-B-like [Actinia tenebrosa]